MLGEWEEIADRFAFRSCDGGTEPSDPAGEWVGGNGSGVFVDEPDDHPAGGA
jgi:hypothetical protein